MRDAPRFFYVLRPQIQARGADNFFAFYAFKNKARSAEKIFTFYSFTIMARNAEKCLRVMLNKKNWGPPSTLLLKLKRRIGSPLNYFY